MMKKEYYLIRVASGRVEAFSKETFDMRPIDMTKREMVKKELPMAIYYYNKKDCQIKAIERELKKIEDYQNKKCRA